MTAHISDRVRDLLLGLGFVETQPREYQRRVAGIAPIGALSADGARIVRLRFDVSGRWLESVDGWGHTIADCDLREVNEAHDAALHVCPALRRDLGGNHDRI